MSRTAIAIRHVPFEDLGAFAPELSARDFTIRYLNAGVDPIDTQVVGDADVLFVLGGPIGANDEKFYPFLTDELRIIEQRVASSRPLAGICLGAQLMARSLGAKVYPGPQKEIGLAPIRLTQAGESSCLAALADGPVLHWHGDTFDLPRNATRLASTSVCENQAFAYGRSSIAFQFHPEATGNQFETWLIAHTFELAAANIDICALRKDWKTHQATLQTKARECIGLWLSSQFY